MTVRGTFAKWSSETEIKKIKKESRMKFVQMLAQGCAKLKYRIFAAEIVVPFEWVLNLWPDEKLYTIWQAKQFIIIDLVFDTAYNSK